MIKKSAIFTTIMVCLAMALVSCPTDSGGGPIVIPGMIDVAGVSGDAYTQTEDGISGFVHNISNFQIAEHEVTYSLWYDVRLWADAQFYYFQNPGCEGSAGVIYPALSATNEPVTTVNWRDAIVWCNAYSEREGLTPVYYAEATFITVIRDSRDANGVICDAAYPNWSANGFRLPTEGEWQFAASNSDAAPWDYASGANAATTDAIETQKVAWYSDNSGSVTHDVGIKINSNGLVLWDMSGNVSEWCWDWFGSYPAGPIDDYQGPAPSGVRVVRGGSWISPANGMQVGRRSNNDPSTANTLNGFRLARSN